MTSQAKLLHAFIWGLKDRVKAELHLRNPSTYAKAARMALETSACVLCITKLSPAGIQDISLNKQGLQIPAQCQWNLAPWREDHLQKAKENKGTYQRSNAMAVANMATSSAIAQRRQRPKKTRSQKTEEWAIRP